MEQEGYLIPSKIKKIKINLHSIDLLNESETAG
jgi:hypothetical protein